MKALVFDLLLNRVFFYVKKTWWGFPYFGVMYRYFQQQQKNQKNILKWHKIFKRISWRNLGILSETENSVAVLKKKHSGKQRLRIPNSSGDFCGDSLLKWLIRVLSAGIPCPHLHRHFSECSISRTCKNQRGCDADKDCPRCSWTESWVSLNSTFTGFKFFRVKSTSPLTTTKLPSWNFSVFRCDNG